MCVGVALTARLYRARNAAIHADKLKMLRDARSAFEWFDDMSYHLYLGIGVRG